MSPQLATVATMLLVAVFVLTNTVSTDGSISGVYRASLRLAEQSYPKGLRELMSGQGRLRITPHKEEDSPQKPVRQEEGANNGKGHNQR